MGSYAGYLVETFVTLAFVCLLAFVVLYGARKLGVVRASGSIKLVGQLPLDARRAIYLVRIGESVIVVGASEGGLTKLAEMAASAVPEELEPKPLRFADVLARMQPRRPERSEDSRLEQDDMQPRKSEREEAP